MFAQIHGTGSADYFACFWPNRDFSLPFAGCVGNAFKEGGGYFRGAYRYPGRYYRFHLDAPIPFYSHAHLRIQHGGESHIRSQYSSLAFLYVSPVRQVTSSWNRLAKAICAIFVTATQEEFTRGVRSPCLSRWIW